MGRKGSRLIPFLKDALFYDKYPNLKYEHILSQAFSLNLPQKCSRLDETCQHILKDWYRLTGRNYKFNVDYTQGKQGMEAALRKSDFLLLIQSGRKKKLIYRMLNDDEVRAKKASKKALKKRALKRNPLEDVDYAPSPESSGYGSGSDVAEEGYNIVSHALLHAFKHDHKYECTIDPQQLENINNENPPPLPTEGLYNADPWSFEHSAQQNCALDDASFNVSNQDKSSCNEIEMGKVEHDSKLQCPLIDENDFAQLFTDDDLCRYGNASESELEELAFRLNDELPQDLEGYVVKNDISAQSILDAVLYKTEMCKVYECKYRQNLRGMILLICEPKMKEFCVSAANLDEPSSSKLIFDEGTMKLMSSCLFEHIQFLSNDHVLVLLKCKEQVN